MTYDEMAVLNFLRGTPTEFLARREIARKALKRTVFEDNPHWADAPLAALVEQGLVEQDDSGHYRIKQGAVPSHT
jgi:DNA-binding IclR family transcriptional regulator